MDDYVQQAVRTEAPITGEMLDRFSRTSNIRLLHAAMGLATEAGELLDALKRHLFYGAPLDRVNVKEELGDTSWYLALAIDELRTTLHDVQTANINKLRARYPDKFAEYDALHRDLTAERRELEK